MTIGIKYCGGCNPRYQRELHVKKLMKTFPSFDYVKPETDPPCDVLLLVCGCPAACASKEKIPDGPRRFVLTCMKDFAEVTEYLHREAQKQRTAGGPRCDTAPVKHVLRIGDRASVSRTFYKEDADKFAALTGDRNRLHTDSEFAAMQWFGRPVVHGVLTASLISTVMGMKLPGDGTILMDEQLEFKSPVYFGDTVTAEVTLIACRETRKFYVGTLYGECRNEKGEIVVCGTCRQMMMKTLFYIENQEEYKNDKS